MRNLLQRHFSRVICVHVWHARTSYQTKTKLARFKMGRQEQTTGSQVSGDITCVCVCVCVCVFDVSLFGFDPNKQ